MMPGPGKPKLIQNFCKSHQHKPMVTIKTMALSNSNNQMVGTSPTVGSRRVTRCSASGQSKSSRPSIKTGTILFGLKTFPEATSG